MAEKKFSELTAAATLGNDDIFALSQMDSGSLASKKTTLTAIANHINTVVQYTNAYGTQAKTTAGAINELKQLISLIPQFSIEVVEELPTEDISDTTIYLVPAEDPEVGNYYEEYIYVNNTWELVGTTAVDLSAYYTKLEVDGLLATKASVTEVALKENKSDMPTDVRAIIKDCKTPKSATITDGIAQFECIEENLVKGLKVTMNPIQDLHGYEYPWAGGVGNNKLDLANATLTKPSWYGGGWNNASLNDGNGLTLPRTYNQGGCGGFVIPTISGDFVISIKGDGTSAYNCGVWYTTDGTDSIEVRSASSRMTAYGTARHYLTFTIPSTAQSIAFSPTCANNVTTPYDIYDIMIERGSTPSTTFAPYSNICPISGRTEASVTRTAGEDVETHTHQYGQTVYGGEDDFVNGGATIEQEKLVFNGTENWTDYARRNGVYLILNTMTSSTYADGLCDRFKTIHSHAEMTSLGIVFGIQNNALYISRLFDGAISGVTDVTSWKTYLSNNNMEITYPLATPTTVSTSAENITTVEGTNIISGTEPISECKYTELATVDDLRKIIGGQ